MHRQFRTFQEAPVEVPECLEPVFANYILVRYSATRFLLDFAQVLPGGCTHRVCARISLTPHDTLLLSQSLDERRMPLVDDGLGYETLSANYASGAFDNGKRQICTPADLPAIACNFVIFSSCQGEIILDFAHLIPSVYRFCVAARLIITPACLNRLCETLEQGLSDYSARYGPVSHPGSQDCAVDNLRSPAEWGLSVPFARN
jgi:hypothetical protein